MYPSGRLYFLTVIIGALALIASQSYAQYTKFVDFGMNTQGLNPYATLISDGTLMYGTTVNGGANNAGTIYKIKPDGSEFTVIHNFNSPLGANPYGGLMYDGSALYGTTYAGGEFGHGTIYKVNPNGTGFTVLFNFEYLPTGGFPMSGLIANGTILYGVTSQGGTDFAGTVFKINKDGTGHTKIIEFNNSNGGSPTGSLIYDGTYLYGLTSAGGASFNGTAYRVKPDGSDFQPLIAFDGTTTGYNPIGSLFFDGTFMWATTQFGGANDRGTLFRILPDGSGYTKFVDFNGTGNGAYPKGSLVSDGTFLYGTTQQGGAGGNGTLFKIESTGSNFSVVVNLDGTSVGPQPEGTLLLSGTTLFLTRSAGGFSNRGNVFKINTNGTGSEQIFSFEVEGQDPVGTLVTDGTFLYGLTTTGGLYDDGTIYRIRRDGTDFERLFDFEETTTGGRPTGSLYLDGTTLYGMASQGGANLKGTIFRINTDGSAFSKLLDFDETNNGSFPAGGLTSDGTFLYGMTTFGGANSEGTIFKIMPNGTGYAKLRDLSASSGAYPQGDLAIDGNVLYGFTPQGGDFGYGTLFLLLTDGDDFNVIIDFDYSNGANPYGTPYSDGEFLYGLTSSGGANNMGNIFKVRPNGTGFQIMMDFEEGDTGSVPKGSFVADDTYLYAVTSSRGVADSGTLFRIMPDGTGFDKLLDFNDGSIAQGSLLSDGIFLYGTTWSGGRYAHGTLFKRSIADHVSITKFSPTAGVAGTYVTILGNDFDPIASHSTVRFNGVAGTVISASATAIVATVPDGATDGPISITANGTDTSITDFTVNSTANMFNGTVRTCGVEFNGVSAGDDLVETFVPAAAGARLKVTFTEMDIDELLEVYDGPNVSSPLVASLTDTHTSFEYTSTSPGGELTFRYEWQDGNTSFTANIECVFDGEPITIDVQPDNISLCENLAATLTTSASGPSNITYQWQFSDDGSTWNDISNTGGYSNATTATLNINTTGSFGAGDYRCRVNGDGAAEVTTDVAVLTLHPSPPPPAGNVVEPVCGPAAMTLTASGGTDGEYRWYTVASGGTAIAGAVNSSFTTPSLAASTNYFVSINDGECESTRATIAASIKTCTAPSISTVQSATSINGIVTIDLTPLISDAENDVDISTLKIVQQPQSGAVATLSGLMLTIDYSGNNFMGTDVVGIEICDLTGLCATQQFNIDVAGDVVVYNAVSPNGDGKNDILLLEFIDVLPSTRDNIVKIYNRWGDEVFSVRNYNNTDRVFNGSNKNGNSLPSGVYFYKISFSSGADALTGYLELKN